MYHYLSAGGRVDKTLLCDRECPISRTDAFTEEGLSVKACARHRVGQRGTCTCRPIAQFAPRGPCRSRGRNWRSFGGAQVGPTGSRLGGGPPFCRIRRGSTPPTARPAGSPAEEYWGRRTRAWYGDNTKTPSTCSRPSQFPNTSTS